MDQPEDHSFRKQVEERFLKLEKALQLNTDSTSRVEKNTQEIVEAFNSAKGAFRALEFIGKLAKPIAFVLGLGTLVATNAAALKSWIVSSATHIIK